MRIKFYRGKSREVVGFLYQFSKTHSGANVVLGGSEGDQNLKELGFGHAEGASVYCYNVIERYGPALLKAWAKVLGATDQIAPTKRGVAQQSASTWAALNVLIQRASHGIHRHSSE